jgi:hypothetical protein
MSQTIAAIKNPLLCRLLERTHNVFPRDDPDQLAILAHYRKASCVEAYHHLEHSGQTCFRLDVTGMVIIFATGSRIKSS